MNRNLLLPLVILVVCSVGCGGTDQPAVDTQPFEEAVARYLEENNMALAIKEVKAGPVVEGARATMTASLTHAELGGPSVTWHFEFEKPKGLPWKVISHHN